jgi:AmpD protein
MLSIDIDTGKVLQAEFIASPNFDSRPEHTEIDLLVIHNISLPPSQFGGSGVIDFFTNQLNLKDDPYYQTIATLKVSSHLFIRRDGELLQFVSLHDRAWHAGKSKFKGRQSCNDFSIGIELEGADDIPYEQSQYQTLIALTQVLIAAYPNISLENIVGHCDIAPGRKTDPGDCFDWNYYRNTLREIV